MRFPFLSDRRGNVALAFALSTPVLAMVGCGAVEMAQVGSDKSAMQDVADAMALRGASEMLMMPSSSVEQQIQSVAAQELADVTNHSVVKVAVTTGTDPASLTVKISNWRHSWFGDLLPRGGFHTTASATATPMNSMPLCVLAHDSLGYTNSAASGDTPDGKPAPVPPPPKGAPPPAPPPGPNGAAIKLDDRSTVTAPSCLVQSNDNIDVAGSASLVAGAVQAGRSGTGRITPSVLNGAQVIPDPFDGYDVNIPSGCPNSPTPVQKVSGAQTLQPGLHCGGFQLSGSAVLTLAAGEHYFVGDLAADQTARVTGDDVVLVFDKDSRFDFKGESTISLRGRRSGPLAGFVVITGRKNNNDFHIQSNHVEELLGTIYVPKARLVVEGQSKVAQSSEWTVIVAKQLQLSGQPNLVINANYATSSVPVPAGVGPKSGAVRLSH